MPLPNGPAIYELAIRRQTLDKDWWISSPDTVNVRDGSLDLRGFNAQSQLILNRPLSGNMAFEAELEYPTHETFNFSLALWTSETLPRELKSRAGGWLLWLPGGNSTSTLKWHNGPDQFGWIWHSKSKVLDQTPYHAPIRGRRYVVRLEAVGERARVFLDGRLFLEGKRPADAAGKDLPMYAAIGQVYAPATVHAVRIHALAESSLPQSLQSKEPAKPSEPPVTKPSGPVPPLAIAPFDATKAKEHQAAWAKHLSAPVELTNSIGMEFCWSLFGGMAS
jgi:hypothetical protein